MDEIHEKAARLLWAVWRSISSDYKSRYRQTVWDQFESTVRASAYTNNLGKFINTLCLKLNAPIASEYIYDAETILNGGQDKELLKVIREETTLLVLMVRLQNEERKAEYQKRLAENEELFGPEGEDEDEDLSV